VVPHEDVSFVSQLAQHTDEGLHHIDGGQHHALQEQASAAAQQAAQCLALLAETGIPPLQMVVYTGFVQVPTSMPSNTCWASPAVGRAPPLLL
jgi:hypothetical protein